MNLNKYQIEFENIQLREIFEKLNPSSFISVKDFYEELKNISKEEEPIIFLKNNIITITQNYNVKKMNAYEFLKKETCNKKNIYLSKFLFMESKNEDNYDFFKMLFMPYLKDSIKKTKMNKLDKEIYNELINYNNIDYLFKNNFKGLKNINVLLKFISNIEDFQIFEKNLVDPSGIKYFFEQLIQKKLQTLSREEDLYYKNFLKILRNYPNLWPFIDKNSKNIKYKSKFSKERAYVEYLIYKEDKDKTQKLIDQHIEYNLKTLNNKMNYTINDLLLLKNTDFRLIIKKNNWYKIILKNGQDLLSIFCLKENIDFETIEMLTKEKDFEEFLKNRKENFLIDIMKKCENKSSIIELLIKKYPFLKNKENEGTIVENLIIKMQSRYAEVDLSILNEEQIKESMIFGNLEKYKKFFKDIKDLNGFHLIYNESRRFEEIKELKNRLYSYNSDNQEKNDYLEFIFHISLLHFKKNLFPQDYENEVKIFHQNLCKINLSIEELMEISMIKDILKQKPEYIGSIIENFYIRKKIQDPVVSVIKKRI